MSGGHMKTRRSHIIDNSKGFTLIELIVVMVILGLLATLVGPRIFGKVEKAKYNAAKTEIEMLGQALDLFRLDVGRYPTTEEGLQALNEDPGIPKNVKSKLQSVIQILSNGDEPTVKVNKALEELDEINEDTNLQQYIRTQLWNVVSVLSQIN